MKSGSAGNRTRSELKKLKRKFKKGSGLLNISRPALSRILNGKSRLSVKALYRISDALDLESATRLVAAYATDLIPKKLQDQMCVCVRKPVKNGEYCWQHWDPFVQKILSLPPDLRSLLERVTDAMLLPHESPLPPGSRDHTQAQGRNALQKIARFPLIPLLAGFLALFAVSPDCQRHYSAILSDCADDPFLHSEIINEQKLL